MTSGVFNGRATARPAIHCVADVHFTRPVGESPVICSCGWHGTVAQVAAKGHANLTVSRSWREADPALPWMQLPDTRLITSAVL